MTDTFSPDDARAQRALWGARTIRVAPGTTLPELRPTIPIGGGGWHPPTDGGADTSGTTTSGTTSSGTTSSTGTQTRAQVVVRRIYCSCTTEAGHDEVYYLWGGVNGAGVQVSHRGPDAYQAADADNATAWDMNDSGDEQNRTLNAVIYDEGLASGQNATFAAAFYESDSQDYGSTVAAAGKLAEGVGDASKVPVFNIAGKILEWVGSLIPKNQDDFLGGFSLRVANNNGNVSIAELAASTYARVISWDRASNRFTMGFRHDDGDYTVDFQVVGR